MSNLACKEAHAALCVGTSPHLLAGRQLYLPAQFNLLVTWVRNSACDACVTGPYSDSGFPTLVTAQCFFIISDSDTTTVIEKDWRTAVVREDDTFITCTNHDHYQEEGHPSRNDNDDDSDSDSEILLLPGADATNIPSSAAIAGMDEILIDSVGRKHHIERQWARARARFLEKFKEARVEDAAISADMLRKWVSHEKITSECTHVSVIMDPKSGDVVWAERYPAPPEGWWERE